MLSMPMIKCIHEVSKSESTRKNAKPLNRILTNVTMWY